MVTLSIVIATYNRFESLKRSLESIFKTLPKNCEVLVIDQSDESLKHKEYFYNKYENLNFIIEKRVNLPNARNVGIKNSNGEIILFFDDDIIVHNNCIKSHIDAHQDSSKYLIAGRTIQSGDIKWADINNIAEIDLANGDTAANFNQTNTFKDIPFAVGCHFSIKRDLIKNVGIFDIAFAGNALYEDLDFSFRSRKKGYTISYIPSAVIEHHTEPNGGCRETKQKDYYLDMLHNRTLFFIKNISILPTKEFRIYIRNLVEYICRIKKGRYSVLYLIKSISIITYAYFHLFTRLFRERKEGTGNI